MGARRTWPTEVTAWVLAEAKSLTGALVTAPSQRARGGFRFAARLLGLRDLVCGFLGLAGHLLEEVSQILGMVRCRVRIQVEWVGARTGEAEPSSGYVVTTHALWRDRPATGSAHQSFSITILKMLPGHTPRPSADQGFVRWRFQGMTAPAQQSHGFQSHLPR